MAIRLSLKPASVRARQFYDYVQIIERDIRLEQIANPKRNFGLNVAALLKGEPGASNFNSPREVLTDGAIEPTGNWNFRWRSIFTEREDGRT